MTWNIACTVHQVDYCQATLTRLVSVPLTYFISCSVKSRPVMNMRRGMVSIRMNGRASDTGLDFTIHRTARHTIWIAVNTCILLVLTCRGRQRPHAKGNQP